MFKMAKNYVEIVLFINTGCSRISMTKKTNECNVMNERFEFVEDISFQLPNKSFLLYAMSHTFSVVTSFSDEI